MVKKALLVGKKSDVDMMEKTLKKNYSMKSVKKIVGAKATKKNIISRLKKLAFKAKPKDNSLFYFSGPGCLIPGKEIKKLSTKGDLTIITDSDHIQTNTKKSKKKYSGKLIAADKSTYKPKSLTPSMVVGFSEKGPEQPLGSMDLQLINDQCYDKLSKLIIEIMKKRLDPKLSKMVAGKKKTIELKEKVCDFVTTEVNNIIHDAISKMVPHPVNVRAVTPSEAVGLTNQMMDNLLEERRRHKEKLFQVMQTLSQKPSGLMMEVDSGFFEQLLNCLCNQKYISNQKLIVQKDWQQIIDNVWNDGMRMLSEFRKP